jgi:hypothetical protein
MIDWLSGVIGGLTVAGLLAFFKDAIAGWFKRKIEHDLARNLESHKDELRFATERQLEAYKSTLEIENAKEVERLKASLHIAAAENQIRLSTLYPSIAETAARTHVLAVKHMLWTDYHMRGTADPATWGERQRMLMETSSELTAYVELRRLYLPEHVAALAFKFERLARDLYWDFHRKIENPTHPDHNPSSETWDEIKDRHNTIVRPAFNDLQTELRRLLDGESNRTNSQKGH